MRSTFFEHMLEAECLHSDKMGECWLTRPYRHGTFAVADGVGGPRRYNIKPGLLVEEK